MAEQKGRLGQTEFWLPVDFLGSARQISDQMRRVETDGWDGYNFADTQCLQPDPFVAMTIAAAGRP